MNLKHIYYQKFWLKLFHLLVLILFFYCNGIFCQAPYEMNMDLDNIFMQSSLEMVQIFKTKVFKLIEAQNQYFELIQQKRPVIGDYEC